MNIQIFGKSKCFDTKKAERFFKERKIKFQSVDLPKYGMSRGELTAVARALGGVEKLIDFKNNDAILLKYISSEDEKIQKLIDNPSWLLTPIVRNGKQATLGYCPDVWKIWE